MKHEARKLSLFIVMSVFARVTTGSYPIGYLHYSVKAVCLHTAQFNPAFLFSLRFLPLRHFPCGVFGFGFGLSGPSSSLPQPHNLHARCRAQLCQPSPKGTDAAVHKTMTAVYYSECMSRIMGRSKGAWTGTQKSIDTVLPDHRLLLYLLYKKRFA